VRARNALRYAREEKSKKNHKKSKFQGKIKEKPQKPRFQGK